MVTFRKWIHGFRAAADAADADCLGVFSLCLCVMFHMFQVRVFMLPCCIKNFLLLDHEDLN